MIDFLLEGLIDKRKAGNSIYNVMAFFILAYMISETDIDIKMMASLVAAGVYMKYSSDSAATATATAAAAAAAAAAPVVKTFTGSRHKNVKYNFIEHNSDIKDIIMDIRKIRRSNKSDFDKAVKHVDNYLYYINVILKHKHKKKYSLLHQVYEKAATEIKNALNSFSYLIHSIPPTPDNEVEEELSDFLFKLDEITKISLEKVRNIINKIMAENPHRNSSVTLHPVDAPKPNSGINSHDPY
jgi:hypothetical protein